MKYQKQAHKWFINKKVNTKKNNLSTLAFIFNFSIKNLVTRFKLPLLLIFVILSNLVSLTSLYNLGNFDIFVRFENLPLLKALFKGKTDIISIMNHDFKYFFIIFW